MLAIDLVSILAGTAGGVVAGFLGWLLGWRSQNPTVRLTAIVVAFVIGFKVAPGVLSIEIERLIGRPLRAAQFEVGYDGAIRDAARRYPGVSRIFRDFPSKEAELRGVLRDLYISRGLRGFEEGGPLLLASEHFGYYVVRALDADLYAFVKSRLEVFALTQSSSPDVCLAVGGVLSSYRNWNFGAARRVLRPDVIERMMSSTSDLVANAAVDPVSYDEKRARRLVGSLPVPNSPLALGLVPADTASASALCGELIALYQQLLSLPAEDRSISIREILREPRE
jgi:hypothetical protein